MISRNKLSHFSPVQSITQNCTASGCNTFLISLEFAVDDDAVVHPETPPQPEGWVVGGKCFNTAPALASVQCALAVLSIDFIVWPDIYGCFGMMPLAYSFYTTFDIRLVMGVGVQTNTDYNQQNLVSELRLATLAWQFAARFRNFRKIKVILNES